MSDSSRRARRTAANELFDKYLLPKVALAFILAASLIGTWVTGTLSHQGVGVVTLAKWVYLVAFGVLVGGLVWKHWFVRPQDVGSAAFDYCAEMYRRFDRIAAGVLIALVVTGPVVVDGYAAVLGAAPIVIVLGGLVVGTVVGTAVMARRSAEVDEEFRSLVGLSTLLLALGALTLTALAEVSLQRVGPFADPMAVFVRALHLLAFAVWVGGAVWNIFVAVPTGQRRPTTAAVQAAGEQLERFRWAVRLTIPTIVATGVYQAVDALGMGASPYLNSVVGLAVVVKLGYVGLLVLIFVTCPMWRACSPIDGVCDLEDLAVDGSSETTTESGADD